MKNLFVIAYAIAFVLSLSTTANAALCKYQLGGEESSSVRVERQVYDVSPKDLMSDKIPNVEWLVVDQGIKSENETHVHLNTDVTIVGKLKEVITDENTGFPVYVQTEGPSRLTQDSKPLEKQNYENHIEGYGTAVGAIKTVEIKSSDSWSVVSAPSNLSSLKASELKSLGLDVGQRVKLTYESGLVVEGNIVGVQFTKSGSLGVISFQDAKADYGARNLFKPAFGKYDLAIAETVEGVNISNDRANLDHKFNSKKYKTDVTDVKRNSLKFFEDVKALFEAQKAKDPKNPYGFPFKWSESTFPYMIAETKNRLHLYKGEHGLYWRKKQRVLRAIYTALGRDAALAKQEAGLKAEVELLERLLSDVEEVSKRTPTYAESLRFSYFFTKTMQITENHRRAPMRMVPYEIFMNSNYGKAVDELELYKSGVMGFTSGRFKFSITDKKVFNPDKLEVIVMPVVGFLLASDLVATRNVPIHFATVASQFAKADGFVLAPYTLYLHDIYFHAGMREDHDAKYFKSRNMNEADISEFRKQQQKWVDDFLVELKKVPDQQMRFAIAQAVQTILHDRGEVLAPSTFNNHFKRNYYYVMKGETYVAMWGQKNFRIDPSYFGILKKMDAAHAWVHEFWEKYKESPY